MPLIKSRLARLFFFSRERGGRDTEEGIVKDLRETVEGIGFKLVEAVVNRLRGATQVRIVIHSPDSVIGIDECSKVHRLVQARLEVILNDQDLSLEVSSPGIDRYLKSESEYDVFKGKGVKAYSRSRGSWVGGILIGREGGSVLIRGSGGDTLSLEQGDIAKIRLDHAEEVR
jgi:ribosome maturation factor RimP